MQICIWSWNTKCELLKARVKDISVAIHSALPVFAKVYFSYRTIGLVNFNILSDQIRVYQTTFKIILMWNKQRYSQSFHQTTGLVSWLILPDRFFFLPEMSGGLVTFGISAPHEVQHVQYMYIH